MKTRKIRVLHILDSLNVGGMENLVISLCNNIDYSKFSVTLLVLSNDQNLLRSKLNASIEVLELPFKYKTIMNVFKLFFLIPILNRKICKRKPDIIHTHCYQFRLFPLFIASLLPLKKRINFHTIHTVGIHYQKLSLWHAIKLSVERFCYTIFDVKVVTVSDIVYDRCCFLWNINKIDLCRINNGVETDISSIGKSPVIDEKYVNIVYVSRLHLGKNHLLLLKAFSMLCSENSNMRLYLLGDGTERGEIVQELKNLNLEKKVFLLGNRNDVLSILKACDIGVFPSLFEGLSLALLEMMSVGLPIVCSDIPEFRKILTDMEDALFFDPTSFVDLYQKLSLLYSNVSLKERLSKRSLLIVKRFSLSKMANEYQQEYFHKTKYLNL